VLAEPTLLTVVFQNLLSNAMKFHGPQPPHITVSARRDGEDWVFAFADNGIGIDGDYAERIFVIFQRLHDKTTYPGTGIGLAMCRKIVEYHGGRIWLDTTATSGSRFLFTLPVLADEMAQTSEIPVPGEPDQAGESDQADEPDQAAVPALSGRDDVPDQPSYPDLPEEDDADE
jgi:light-regulated signal transduction histidine kinase (bacteriophytochrome)